MYTSFLNGLTFKYRKAVFCFRNRKFCKNVDLISIKYISINSLKIDIYLKNINK